jgi:hypothetical protein
MQNQEQHKKTLRVRYGMSCELRSRTENACKFGFVEDLAPYFSVIFRQREKVLNASHFAFLASKRGEIGLGDGDFPGTP